jgi:hypothetical protein
MAPTMRRAMRHLNYKIAITTRIALWAAVWIVGWLALWLGITDAALAWDVILVLGVLVGAGIGTAAALVDLA